MNCRICNDKCKSDAPQFQGLCQICGQKREAYAAAALPAILGALPNAPNGNIEDRRARVAEAAFGVAEAMVTRDRKPMSPAIESL